MTVASICGPNCGAQLYVHVVGTTALFGAILAVTILALAASTAPEQGLVLGRIGFWITLVLAVPAYLASYIGGLWLLNHEHLDKNTPNWAGVGFTVLDAGGIAILLMLLLGWLSRRRPNLNRAIAVLGVVYLLALGFAWFAMSGKPSL